MSEDTAVLQAELKVADTVGRLMQFWGFKRPMGRLWTVLYLSPEPLGAAELGDKLHMSSGAISMTLSELLKWGAVHKTWLPGERRDFYQAETSIWKLVQRVIRERELGLVHEFGDTLAEAEGSLKTKPASVAGFKRQRLARLRELSQLGERLLSALAEGNAVDPTPILRASSRVADHGR
jgi:DNA-binding transcriptional regulator GbsR (MarR family)